MALTDQKGFTVSKSSGNVAAAVATATLPSLVNSTLFITGFSVTGSGATTALPVTVTVTGLIGGTLSYTYVAIAGVLSENTSLDIVFPQPLSATAKNVAIAVSCPSLGA